MLSSEKHSLMHSVGAALFTFIFASVLIAARVTMSAAHGPDSSDTQFAFNAAMGGISEVKLGTLATQKGSETTVKDFGQRMVTDHSKAGEELKSIALQAKIALPADVSKDDAELYARLSKLSGKEFDMAYADEMVKDHEKDVEEFQREATSGSNPQLKDFAARTLPILQSHLQQARGMQKTVRASFGK